MCIDDTIIYFENVFLWHEYVPSSCNLFATICFFQIIFITFVCQISWANSSENQQKNFIMEKTMHLSVEVISGSFFFRGWQTMEKSNRIILSWNEIMRRKNFFDYRNQSMRGAVSLKNIDCTYWMPNGIRSFINLKNTKASHESPKVVVPLKQTLSTINIWQNVASR